MTPFELALALQEARRRRALVTWHPAHDLPMIDGARADIWMRIKDKECTIFRGRQLVKEGC